MKWCSSKRYVKAEVADGLLRASKTVLPLLEMLEAIPVNTSVVITCKESINQELKELKKAIKLAEVG